MEAWKVRNIPVAMADVAAEATSRREWRGAGRGGQGAVQAKKT